MKLYCHNFGCKLNLAETQAIAATAQTIGYRLVFDVQKADVVFINGCHVTQKAHQKLIGFINRVGESAQIVVTGCLPQNFCRQNHPARIKVFSSTEKGRVIPFLTSLVIGKNYGRQLGSQLRTRHFIKIQSGCDTRCSYCIIPYYRGSSTSLSPPEIIQQINSLPVDTKEIVLTGTNLGQYNWKKNQLADLLLKIIHSTDIPRVRVSSIDVTDIDDRLIQVFANSKLCPHLHLALQSGSDKILQSMKRPYNRQQYIAVVQQVQSIPNLSITTDVIVGFPGETELDFAQTLSLISSIPFLKVHTFSYSEHPQTRSAHLKPKIPRPVIKDRYQQLIQVARTRREQVMSTYQNKIMPVLFEQSKHNYLTGYTPNYIPVKVSAKPSLINQVLPVRITKTSAQGAIGAISQPVNHS